VNAILKRLGFRPGCKGYLRGPDVFRKVLLLVVRWEDALLMPERATIVISINRGLG